MYRFYCNPKWVRGVWSKVADVVRQQTIYISLRLFWAQYWQWKSNVGHFEPITIICFQKNAEKHPCLTTSFRPWNHFCVLQLRWWSNFIDNTYTKFHGYIDTKYTGKLKYRFAGSNLSTLPPRSTDPCHGFYGLNKFFRVFLSLLSTVFATKKFNDKFEVDSLVWQTDIRQFSILEPRIFHVLAIPFQR